MTALKYYETYQARKILLYSFINDVKQGAPYKQILNTADG